jgi:hypothetical protein
MMMIGEFEEVALPEMADESLEQAAGDAQGPHITRSWNIDTQTSGC